MKNTLLKRNLIYELVLRDLKLRYAQPFLGFLWAFLLPFITAGIFYIIFSVFLKVKTEGAPFFLYLMTAIFSWSFFQASIISSTTSLVDNRNIIKESRFPHYFIPVSIVLANFITFLPPLVILIIISSVVLKGLPVFIIFLPLVLFAQLSITIGLAIILSILYVRWRDIKYIVELLLLLLFYMTPVFYPLSVVKSSFSGLMFKAYLYNPFVGILTLYRAVVIKGFYGFLSSGIGRISFIFTPFIFSAVVLFFGFYYYKVSKDKINDYLSY